MYSVYNVSLVSTYSESEKTKRRINLLTINAVFKMRNYLGRYCVRVRGNEKKNTFIK